MSGILILILIIIIIAIIVILVLVLNNKSPPSSKSPLGAVCLTPDVCDSGNCSGGICQKSGLTTGTNGAYCNLVSNCPAGTCLNNTCTIGSTPSNPNPPNPGTLANCTSACTADSDCISGNCQTVSLLSQTKVCQPANVKFGDKGSCCTLGSALPCSNGLQCQNPQQTPYGQCIAGTRNFFEACPLDAASTDQFCAPYNTCQYAVPSGPQNSQVNTSRCLYLPNPNDCSTVGTDSNYKCNSGKLVGTSATACFAQSQCSNGCNNTSDGSGNTILVYDSSANSWNKYVSAATFNFTKIIAISPGGADIVYGLDLNQGVFYFNGLNWIQVLNNFYSTSVNKISGTQTLEIVEMAVTQDNKVYAAYRFYPYRTVPTKYDYAIYQYDSTASPSATIPPLINLYYDHGKAVFRYYNNNTDYYYKDIVSMDAIVGKDRNGTVKYCLTVIGSIDNSKDKAGLYVSGATVIETKITDTKALQYFGPVTCNNGKSPNQYPFSQVNLGSQTKARYINNPDLILSGENFTTKFNNLTFNIALNYTLTITGVTETNQQMIGFLGVLPGPNSAQYQGVCSALDMPFLKAIFTPTTAALPTVAPKGYNLNILDFCAALTTNPNSNKGATLYMLAQNSNGLINLYLAPDMSLGQVGILPGYYDANCRISATGNNLYMFTRGYCF